MTRTEYTRRVHQTNQVLLAEAQQEVESLRTQLSRTQLLNAELQSLLEVDQDAHPSNKKAKAHQAQLVTAQSELETARNSLATKAQELDRRNATYDIMKTQSKAYKQSNEDLQKSNASFRTKLEAALKEKATMSAAIEAKTRSWKTFARMMSSRTQRTILARTGTKRRMIPCVRT